MFGLYPVDQHWRVITGGVLLVVGCVPLFLPRCRARRSTASASRSSTRSSPAGCSHGGGPLAAEVDTPLWGGLFLTLMIAIVGIVASFPIGILLALGRRSDMPVVKALCVAFIELVRGVPLITVLFMASVMLPLFFPPGWTIDKLLRALIGVALFSGAYMAEVIRGGLQAIPKGQYEAAEALGLGYWQKMGLIILPQALRIVIPGIVNTFIGLFKDTSLVLIIGLFDLLGIVQADRSPARTGLATTSRATSSPASASGSSASPCRATASGSSAGCTPATSTRETAMATTQARERRADHRAARRQQVVRPVPRAAGTSTSRSGRARRSWSAGRRARASRP